ncbi:helix-turn-helix domain-containing protein [Actinoplanes sp. NPDC051633]|uniref:helix-turn-helix domain-containing protein n=1 Tax=Actinoplanes sp. NPDC051633 TaxID=3155670 RepID=UPI0034344CB2
MGMGTKERTVFPPEDLSDLNRLARELAGPGGRAGARLIGPDGSELVLPDELHELLRLVVDSLSQGMAITLAPHNTMLTTQEAADLLGVSRPTLVRLLTEGFIPYTRRGRHRRLLLADVVDYQSRTRSERRSALDEMTADAEDMGLYGATTTPEATR